MLMKFALYAIMLSLICPLISFFRMLFQASRRAPAFFNLPISSPSSEHPNNASWHVAAAAIGPDYEDDGLRRRRSGGLQSISGAAAQGNDIADADAVDEMLHNGQSVFGPRRNGRYFDV